VKKRRKNPPRKPWRKSPPISAARAVNGEDPDKLQMEAYTEAGLPGTTPYTKMEKMRRDTLPPQHEKVMNLKPGEVSEIFSDPGGAYFIYKMISKETLTLEDVKTEIPHHNLQPAISRAHEKIFKAT